MTHSVKSENYALGVRRCLPKGSLVHLKRGLVPIEDVKVGDDVLTTKGYKQVTDWFDQGRRKLIRIVHQDGDFVCTENHRMPVLTYYNEYKWVEAGKLKPNHRLISSRVPIDGVKTYLPIDDSIIVPELDEQIAWLIGLFHSCGVVNPDFRNNGSNANMTLNFKLYDHPLAVKAIAQLSRFGQNLSIGIDQSTSTRSLVVICKNAPLVWYFTKNIGQVNNVFHVQDWLLQSKQSIKLAYIAGLYDGDGTDDKPAVLMTTLCEQFAKDVQTLLYSCGFESRRSKIVDECTGYVGWNSIHMVKLITARTIRSIASIPQLYRKISIGHRNQHLNSYKLYMTHNNLHINNYKRSGHNTITVDRYDALEENSSDICPVKVMYIEDAGIGQTYDITVDGPNESDGTHEFYVNGYLSHNTAEMFMFDPTDHEVLFAKYGINGIYSKDQFDHHVKLGHKLEDLHIKPKWFDELTTMYQQKGIASRQGLHHRHMSNNSILFESKPDYKYLELLIDIIRYDGEPGLVNFAEMKRRRPNAELINPCVTADTAVLTDHGPVLVKDLIGKQFMANINGQSYPSTNEGFYPTGNKDVYKLRTVDGHCIRLTNNHQVLIKRDSVEMYVPAGQLTTGDSIVLNRITSDTIQPEYNEMTLNHYLGGTVNCNQLLCQSPARYHSFIADVCNKRMCVCSPRTSQVHLVITHNDRHLLSTVQQMLLYIGINSKLTGDGLEISDSNIKVFNSIIKTCLFDFIAELVDKYQSEWTPDLFESKFASLTYDKKEAVYDCTIDTKHCFSANGLMVHNCGEVILDTYQTCNLTTVNLTQFIKSRDDGSKYLDTESLYEAQKMSTRCGLRMTLVTLELSNWDVKQKRDRLIGTSLTGIKDTLDQLKYTRDQERELLKSLAQVARTEAVNYAKQIRVPAPLLVTTIKPEGSISQMVGGVSQGLHLSHSPYFIRRIRINANDPMVSVMKSINWTINPEVGTSGDTYEERMKNARTYVVDFPVACNASKTKNDTSVFEQFETYFMYQENYADHNCSNTITVKPDEWCSLPKLIYDNWDKYLGITFISLDGGTYQLAPYEECTQEQYQALVNRMKPFDVDLLNYYDRQNEVCDDTEESQSIQMDETMKSECSGGVCPMR